MCAQPLSLGSLVTVYTLCSQCPVTIWSGRAYALVPAPLQFGLAGDKGVQLVSVPWGWGRGCVRMALMELPEYTKYLIRFS